MAAPWRQDTTTTGAQAMASSSMKRSPSQRSQTYQALKAAGFDRDFARRHDKASPVEVRYLIEEVRKFGQYDTETLSLERQARRGSKRAAQKLAERRKTRAAELVSRGVEPPKEQPIPKPVHVRDVEWYRETSDRISKELRRMKRELPANEYAYNLQKAKDIRKVLRIKALEGPAGPTKAQYLQTSEDLAIFFDVDEDDWSVLYGSEGD